MCVIFRAAAGGAAVADDANLLPSANSGSLTFRQFRVADVGDAKPLVLHPASPTHRQLSTEDLEAAGIGEDLIRVSVGIEDVRDIIDDLSTALKISQR